MPDETQLSAEKRISGEAADKDEHVNMNIEAGFTPWESMYSDKFNVVNIGLSATKDIKITSNFSLPIFGKLIANPYEEQLYFVVGITL